LRHAAREVEGRDTSKALINSRATAAMPSITARKSALPVTTSSRRISHKAVVPGSTSASLSWILRRSPTPGADRTAPQANSNGTDRRIQIRPQHFMAVVRASGAARQRGALAPPFGSVSEAFELVSCAIIPGILRKSGRLAKNCPQELSKIR
jgi:hypothetical protein